MPTRTTIELHPDGCRLVELRIPTARRRPVDGDARVRTFITHVRGSDDPRALGEALARLRHERKLARDARVVIWGLRAIQQFLRVPPAKPADLAALAEREARKDIAALDSEGERAVVGIAAGAEIQVGSHRRREVSLVAASGADVRRRIAPLTAAGFDITAVITPALALAALARSRRDHPPGASVLYAALAGRATCVAIVRDGFLLFSREIPWGHAMAAGPSDVAERVGSELRRSVLFFKQSYRAAVDMVVLCGDLPDMRALTGPLGDELGLPVQTLDSLSGVDATALPQPAEAFRADISALRLAIAAGAAPSLPIDLLPPLVRIGRETRLRAIRMAAALVASVVLGGGWYAMAASSAARHQADIQQMQRELAELQPRERQLVELHQAHATAVAQRAALGAFESQGPRLARVLEVVAASAPQDVVLSGIGVQSTGVHWSLAVTGTAVTDNPASGQAAVNAFLRALTASPYVGAPSQAPSLRMVSGTAAAGQGSGRAGSVAIPEGSSGVQFTLTFEVAK